MQRDKHLAMCSSQVKNSSVIGQKRWLKAVMILFGLSLSTNVVYAFTVGNTCVYIGYVFALILCGYLFVSDRNRGGAKLDLVDGSIWAFIAIACLSILPAIIYAFSAGLPMETPLVVMRGLVVLLCGVAVYYAVARLADYAKYVVIGIALGILANGLVSLLQMIAYNSGSFFTLYYLFPQSSFSISANWSIWGTLPEGAGRIPSFRSQGLFLEASHLMIFLACLAPVAFVSLRSIAAKVGVLTATVFCCATSFSPNVLFILVASVWLLLSYLNRSSSEEFRLRRGWVLVAITAVFVLACVIALHLDFIVSTFSSVISSIADLNVFTSNDAGTIDRWESMLKALSTCIQYPLGAGWNTESIVLSYEVGEVASHSYLIRLLLEVSIVGVIAYFILISRHCKALLSRNSNIEDLAIGVAVLILFVCQATNGMTLLPWAWALMGLSSVATKRITRRRVNE